MGSKKLEFKQEFLRDCYDEAQELLQMHWSEVALNKDAIKLNPDIEQYEEAEKAGCLRIFTARADGLLVGYFALIVQRSLHYMDHAFATNDVIFLHPDHRRGYAARKLIEFATQCLEQDGCSMLFINTKVHKPFDMLLGRMGFDHIENVYAKRLI